MGLTPEELADIARNPAKAAQDGRSAEQHSLKDLIELDRHLKSQELPEPIEVNGRKMTRFGVRTAQYYPMD